MRHRPLDFVKFVHTRAPHALWEEFFGQYPWFFTPLLGEAVAESGLKSSSVFLRTSKIAPKLMPGHWSNIASWADWRSISHVQFRAALGQELVRLDKAIMASAMVGIINEPTNTSENDLLNDENNQLLIVPSTFVIDGIERFLKSEEEIVTHLMKETGQRRIFFDEVARGYAVAEYIAYEIVELCANIGFKRVDVRLLKDRRDGERGRLTRPVSYQSLNNTKIVNFYLSKKEI